MPKSLPITLQPNRTQRQEKSTKAFHANARLPRDDFPRQTKAQLPQKQALL
jgi:hypothetical protein